VQYSHSPLQATFSTWLTYRVVRITEYSVEQNE